MARHDGKSKVSHSERHYMFVVDYGQNMEIPVFKDQQPGVTYYYSPLSIYNLGMVDQAHNNGDGEFKDQMFCHVYHKGVGMKGANNVCSIILKTLRLMDIMKQDDMGGELNVIFDNCSGQKQKQHCHQTAHLADRDGILQKSEFHFSSCWSH